MSNPTKERICGVIPLHGGYPCYFPEGHETYHSDGYTTWPTMYHKIAPDPHALLRDKLRELVGRFQTLSAEAEMRAENEPAGTYARGMERGGYLANLHCALELSTLIEGAK